MTTCTRVTSPESSGSEATRLNHYSRETFFTLFPPELRELIYKSLALNFLVTITPVEQLIDGHKHITDALTATNYRLTPQHCRLPHNIPRPNPPSFTLPRCLSTSHCQVRSHARHRTDARDNPGVLGFLLTCRAASVAPTSLLIHL